MRMNTSGAKSRLAEINVTPLVDVMLVLLIVFMVSAPLMQQGIEVALPKVSTEAMTTEETAIVLSIKKTGGLSWDGKSLSWGQLKERLKIAGKEKNIQVIVQADTAVEYGVVARAMGLVKSSGISKVGLATAPAEE
jgi:biopolymer transport protein TolR